MSPTTTVEAKTGHTRDEWFAILDKAGALEWDYAQTVAYFEKKHRTVSAWWRQPESASTPSGNRSHTA